MALALGVDFLLGDPRRWHPVAGLGSLAERAERWLRGGDAVTPAGRRTRGTMAVALIAGATGMFVAALEALPMPGWLVDATALWITLGWRGLISAGRGLSACLGAGDLDGARALAAGLVSRDLAATDAGALSRAGTESILENGNDAVIAPLFWFAVAGAPGAAVFRAVNTLDAMWGYRTPRYRDFGWAAARLDDVLGWVPARLTALAYLAAGGRWRAAGVVRRQARDWKSANAGHAMAAGGWALDVRLGGPARYHGRMIDQPVLGGGNKAAADTPRRAARLVTAAGLLTAAALVLLDFLVSRGPGHA